MQPVTVVILQSNGNVAHSLVNRLLGSFQSVLSLNSLAQLDTILPKHSNSNAVMVLDMEATSLREISVLAESYPALRIVCNHRIPDERLWVQAVEAGAIDCCSSNDLTEIVRAVHANANSRAAA